MNTQKKLEDAYKTYGHCAKKITNGLGDANPNSIESEQIIAFGIVVDWCRRASSLKPLQYESRLLNKQKRSIGVTEIIRFNMAWSGINALFSRQSVLDLLPPTSASSELSKFRVLYNNASLDPSTVSRHEKTLRDILLVPITTRIPGLNTGEAVTTLHALHYKYTPAENQTRGVGKNIQNALNSNNYSGLDLPMLIYSMRNWSVHGGIIDSSFRSEDRFKLYIDTILNAVADVHLGISKELLQQV